MCCPSFDQESDSPCMNKVAIGFGSSGFMGFSGEILFGLLFNGELTTLMAGVGVGCSCGILINATIFYFSQKQRDSVKQKYPLYSKFKNALRVLRGT